MLIGYITSIAGIHAFMKLPILSTALPAACPCIVPIFLKNKTNQKAGMLLGDDESDLVAGGLDVEICRNGGRPFAFRICKLLSLE